MKVAPDRLRGPLGERPLRFEKPSPGGKPQGIPLDKKPLPRRGLLPGPGGFVGDAAVAISRDVRMNVETIQVDGREPVRTGSGRCLRVKSNGSRLVLRGRGFGERRGTVLVGLGIAQRLLAGAGRRVPVTVTRWTDTSIELDAGTIYPRTGEGERPVSQALLFAISRPDGGGKAFIEPVCPERRVISAELAGRLLPSRLICRSSADGRFDVNVVVTKHDLSPSPTSVVGRATVTIRRADSRGPSAVAGWSGRFRLSLPAWDQNRLIRTYGVRFSCRDGAAGSMDLPAVPWTVRFEENEWYKRSFVRLLDEAALRRTSHEEPRSEYLPNIVENAAPLYIRSISVWSEPGDHPKGSTPGIRVVVAKLTSGPVPDSSVVRSHVIEIQPAEERSGMPSPRPVRLRLQPDGSGTWKAELGPEATGRLRFGAASIEWGSQIEVRLGRVRGRREAPALIERRRVRIPEARGWDVVVRLKEIRVRESGDDDLTRGDGDWEEVFLSFGRDCLQVVDIGTTSVADGDVLRPVTPSVCTVRRTSLPVEGFVAVYEDDGISTSRMLHTAMGRFRVVDPSIPLRSPRSNFRVQIRGRGLDADAFLEIVLRRSVPEEATLYWGG